MSPRSRWSPAALAELLHSWRRQPLAAVAAAGVAALIVAAIIAQGGPPTPLVHPFYLVIIFTAMTWGPRVGAASGAACALLSEPVALALLGRLDEVSLGSAIRTGGMILVGAVCGCLSQALLARIEELEDTNLETILAFAQAIDARDPYTARHSERVAAYGRALARELDLPEAHCERIYLSGLVHDVGKVGLERTLLHKPGRLDDDEWDEVRAHPVLSAQIVGRVSRLAHLLPGVRHHHERFDGTGYPDGLMGFDIPLEARVLAVADAYEAMTSDRSYRTGMSHADAVARLREGSGTQFDPRCVEAFTALDLHDVAFTPLIEMHVAGALRPCTAAA